MPRHRSDVDPAAVAPAPRAPRPTGFVTSRRAALTLVLGLAAVQLAPARAHAQSAADDARARAHFERGMEFVQQSRWSDALGELEQARAIRPVPAVLFNLGVAHRALGHSRAAVEALEAYLRAVGAEGDAARRAEASGYIAELRASVSTLHIEVAPGDASLTVDGEPVPRGTTDLEVDPGVHLVGASAPGRRPAQRSVRVAARGRVSVPLALEALPGGGSRPFPVGPVVVLGAGVLAFGATAIFGVLRGVAFGNFEATRCTAAGADGVVHCDPDAASDPNYQTGIAMTTGTDVSLVVGGVALLAGGIWLAVSLARRDEPVPASARATLAPRLTPALAPGHAGGLMEVRF